MPQTTISVKLTDKQINLLDTLLEAKGWKNKAFKSEYIASCRMLKGSGICTIYKSSKVVFQGSDAIGFSSLLRSMESEAPLKVDPHLGVDEVGKGDYFGPLVVASCFVDENIVHDIIDIGVGDSKKFSDDKITEMYSQLREICSYYVSVVSPLEYNHLYADIQNLQVLLARQHAKVIEDGLTDLKAKNIKCRKVVIDQFSTRKDCVPKELGPLGKKVNLVQFHNGESDIAVACASIIARGIFIEEWNDMCAKYNFDFPKGATNVISAGKKFVEGYGAEELNNVAKISFRTTDQIFERPKDNWPAEGR
ncbi:ribonuclease HIII [bacterium]|nr:ribonuclease HIII [bacterium]